MPQKILVTGANGQLGSEIRLLSGNYNHEFLYTDIDETDLSERDSALSFLARVNPDIVINCAAYTAVDKAEEEPDIALKVNAGIPANLAEFATENNKIIVHLSTDYVFSGMHPLPLSESDPTNPKSVYGITKLEGEKAIQHIPRYLILRTSWLYSVFGNNFVKTMLKLLYEKDELKVVFDQLGSPTYATDLATAILQIIDRNPDQSVSGIYHYANEGVASWYDFAFEIQELAGTHCNINPVLTGEFPRPAPRPVYSVFNKEKVKQTFGLTIPHWKTSLGICIEKIMNQH